MLVMRRSPACDGFKEGLCKVRSRGSDFETSGAFKRVGQSLQQPRSGLENSLVVTLPRSSSANSACLLLVWVQLLLPHWPSETIEGILSL